MTSHIISDIVDHQGDIFTVNEDGQYTMLGRHADVIKTADGHVSDTLSYVFDHKAHFSFTQFYPKSLEDICASIMGVIFKVDLVAHLQFSSSPS